MVNKYARTNACAVMTPIPGMHVRDMRSRVPFHCIYPDIKGYSPMSPSYWRHRGKHAPPDALDHWQDPVAGPASGLPDSGADSTHLPVWERNQVVNPYVKGWERFSTDYR